MNSSSSECEDEASFNPYDSGLYLFDDMDRRSAEDLLRVSNVGTFLIRRSATKSNSYSLSLRYVNILTITISVLIFRISLEDENSIRHYIIEQKQQGPNTVYHVKVHSFKFQQIKFQLNGADYRDFPALVSHFTINQLGSSKNSTYLRQPAPKQVIEKVIFLQNVKFYS